MEEQKWMRLEIIDDQLYLERKLLKGVEYYKLKKESTMPEGTAELELKVIVNLRDVRAINEKRL